jgi:hypothetical protein
MGDQLIDPGKIVIPPGLLAPTIRVVRPQDMVVLELRLFNLKLDAKGANLVRAGAGDAFLSLGFPPQNVAEQAFFQKAKNVKYKSGNPPKDPQLPEPAPEPPSMPVQALVSGPTHLVFKVPAGTPPIPYTLQGLLQACSTLEPSAAANAAPPPKRIVVQLTHPVVTKQTGPIGVFLNQVRAARRARTFAAAKIDPAVEQTAQQIQQAIKALVVSKRPKPAPPGDTHTSIEAPYRLIVSPSVVGRWAHSSEPVEPEKSDRTELWHTRLGVQGTQGVDEQDDYYRTVRAIWTRDPDFDPTLESDLPPHFPQPNDSLRMSLDHFDRHNIVHQSSNFALKTDAGKAYVPSAIEVDGLMLSALGAWLDLRGVWPEPKPPKLAVEEWRQRGTLGRDHYVRVVYAGKLFPNKHIAALIKVTERKFHRDKPGNPAFLRQRMYIVTRRPLETYSDILLPYQSLLVKTLVTPDLDPPEGALSAFDNPPPVLQQFTGQSLFWPHVHGKAFPFGLVGGDLDGRPSEFGAPQIFVGREVLTDKDPGKVNDRLQAIKAEYDSRVDADGKLLAEVALLGQKVAYADSANPDDTSLETESITFQASVTGITFSPQLAKAKVIVPALKHLADLGDALEVKYPDGYKGPNPKDGNKGELFLQKTDTAADVTLSFDGHGDRSGGFVQPNMELTGLSRRLGPVAGDAAQVKAGTFDAGQFFGALDSAKLFGVIPLADLVAKVDKGLDTPAGLDQSPSFAGQAVDVVEKALLDLRRLEADLSAGGMPIPPAVAAVVSNPATLGAQAGALTNALQALPAALTPNGNLTKGLARRIETRVADLVDSLGAQGFSQAVTKHAAGDELPLVTDARFEWRPTIKSFPASNPIFQANPRGLTVAAQVLTQDTTGGPPRLNVTCLLEDFQLHLIAPATFITINVDELELILRDGKKPDVNLKLKDPGGVVFDGPLSFVNELQKWIPADGFSDPPGLSVTKDGIVASYSLGLPNIAVGVFSLQNLSVGAGFTIPFVGADPLDVSFNFCTRENPSLLTVTLFGGGFFFGITINPQGVHILEAAIEFGAAISIDLGVASGGVSAMAGIYFKIESNEASLTGYFRLRGEVEVLGIVSVSLEMYMELSYEFSSGKCVGRATISVSVEIAFVEETVEISCERRFAGSSGDPTFEQLVPAPAWADYCGAFA